VGVQNRVFCAVAISILAGPSGWNPFQMLRINNKRRVGIKEMVCQKRVLPIILFEYILKWKSWIRGMKL
jgi:hypothetical protein